MVEAAIEARLGRQHERRDERGRREALRLQGLGQGRHVVGQRHRDVVADAVLGWVPRGEERGMRRPCHGHVRCRILGANAFPRDAVEVRRRYRRVAVGAKPIGPQRVDGDDDEMPGLFAAWPARAPAPFHRPTPARRASPPRRPGDLRHGPRRARRLRRSSSALQRPRSRDFTRRLVLAAHARVDVGQHVVAQGRDRALRIQRESLLRRLLGGLQVAEIQQRLGQIQVPLGKLRPRLDRRRGTGAPPRRCALPSPEGGPG